MLRYLQTAPMASIVFYGLTKLSYSLYGFNNYSKMGYAGENKTFTLEWFIQVKKKIFYWAMQAIIFFIFQWAMEVKYIYIYYSIGVCYVGKKV